MSIIRTYFDKNNTIISDLGASVNTGRNPVSEIFYGVNKSRFLFYVDLEEIRQKISSKSIDIPSITRHTLKMKNTSNFDVLPFRDYRGQIQFSNKQHSTSFDLELLPVSEYWDEGIGYDFQLVSSNTDESAFLLGASNWTNRTNENTWVNEGSVQTGATMITTQHFDKGNEDLELDITDYVNTILTGATGYAGFCLKYTDYFENVALAENKYVGFFTRHTHTFFEPFIETEYNDLVKDDRKNFILDQSCNLVLYVFKQGNLFNLDQLPVCSIGAANFTVTHISTGIYSADVLLSSGTYHDFVMYHDIWSSIYINSVRQPNVTMDITPQPSSQQYQIGATSFETIPYGISVSGIKRDENITQGENRKILVHLRKPYTVSEVTVVDNIYYRLYVKQGINQVVVIDWTEINRSFDSNYFFIDTSWMVPQQYFIDIKLNIREETRLFNEELKFSIISQLF